MLIHMEYYLNLDNILNSRREMSDLTSQVPSERFFLDYDMRPNNSVNHRRNDTSCDIIGSWRILWLSISEDMMSCVQKLQTSSDPFSVLSIDSNNWKCPGRWGPTQNFSRYEKFPTSRRVRKQLYVVQKRGQRWKFHVNWRECSKVTHYPSARECNEWRE